MDFQDTTRRQSLHCCVLTVLLANGAIAVAPDSRAVPWQRHTIDRSSRGADGVKLCDVNGDGLADIVTGWEEGGVTRVYLHPGPGKCRSPWPAVTVGKTPDVEDAVFVDLDGDGNVDVVSFCEGRTRTVFIHWAPRRGEHLLAPDAWTTQILPASHGVMQWMYGVPMQVDGRRGIDLAAGGKGDAAYVGWFESPENPRDLAAWRWHPLSPVGWVMSLKAIDMDGDGDLDLLLSDRKGSYRGVRWLENPGEGPALYRPWTSHPIGGDDCEVMFLALGDLDGDGVDDIVCATRGGPILFFRRDPHKRLTWQRFEIAMPQGAGGGKGVAIGDLDGNGRNDLVLSCEGAVGGRSGVVWLSFSGFPQRDAYTAREISGPQGVKFDRIELLDVDGDGDLDVLTCEESEVIEGRSGGLGVVWYENPLHSPPDER